MKQVLIRRGNIAVENVPAPLVEPGNVLVEVGYSLISAGTEISSVQGGRKSLVARAVEQPDKVLKVIEHLRSQGLQRTVARVRGQLDAGYPTGYSCSGIVIQVGEGVTDVYPGDRVACAGAGIANHAEIVLVPRNLMVSVPEGCSLRDAASVTIGSIAMQGVRRADPRLGETVALIGLGLVGQLTLQLLKAAGCRVIGFDLDQRRIALAQKLGADHAFDSSTVDVPGKIRQLTEGHGADSVIITAGSQSDVIVQQAMEMARRKGRVVVVGAVGLGLQRSPFYEKELDFLISCSYGPGRYDARYEEEGVDYPYAYVRWTENRNMGEYLRLVAEGKVQLDLVLEQEYEVAEATQAYQALQTSSAKPLGVVLRYPLNGVDSQQAKLSTRVDLRKKSARDKINLAIVGAGGFAKGMHLPNLQKLQQHYHLRAIVSGTGSNAKATAEQFEADYASTNYEDVLDDPDVDAVMISTRHNLHAEQAEAAAKAGKAIFVEKPMAITQEELSSLVQTLKETQVPFMVGFNRRFSPAAQRARAILGEDHGPLMLNYRVNAGYLPPDHWTLGKEGGGRLVGEGCHMVDLFKYLVGPFAATEVNATKLTPKSEHLSSADNVILTVSYADGSVANLLYTALGASDFGKEYLEIFCENCTLVLDDYRALRVFGTSTKGWEGSVIDKGHVTELEIFARYAQQSADAPISLDDLVETTKITLQAAGL